MSKWTKLCLVNLDSFTVIGSDVLQSVYGFDQEFSDSLLLLPCLSTIICAPLIGIFIDRFGKLTNILCIACVLYVTFHMYILYGAHNEIIIICLLLLLGVAFAMFATAMWASVPLTAHSSTIGIANGLCYMSYALLNSVGQFIAGELTLDTLSVNIIYKYYYVEIFFIFTSLFMLICAVSLAIYDWKSDKTLYSAKRKRVWE